MRSNRDYTTFILCIIIILGALSVIAMGTVIGIIAGIITIISSILVGPRTIKGIKSWWLLRKPMQVNYLVPQSQYERKQFLGAPLQEIKPNRITIGIGKYQLLMIHVPKITLTPSYSPYIEIVGNNDNKPKLFLLDRHPFIVEETYDDKGNILRTDWHGVTVVIDPNKIGKRQYVANTAGMIARGIHTFGNWKGSINITWCVTESDKSFTTSLELEISELDGKDQIPFLKIDEE